MGGGEGSARDRRSAAGDRIGHRRTLLISSTGFILGAGVLASANGPVTVEIGLALCGSMAVAMQIVALGLLQRTLPEGNARISAFTTYGMVFPLAFLVFPVLTAALLAVGSWRWIPIIWACAGALIAVITYLLLDRHVAPKPIGEWITPVLAGIALSAAARGLAEVHHVHSIAHVVVICMAISLGATVGCAIIMRRPSQASFTLRPI